MNAFQGYLEKLGGNFLVASFIPSLAFVTISIVTFGPIIPLRVLNRFHILLTPLGELSVEILLISVIIGFTLTTVNTQVYKLFEGYVLFRNLSFFRNLELKRARAIRDERDSIIRRIERLQKQLDTFENSVMQHYPKENAGKIQFNIQKRIKELEAQRDDISAAYDQNYPPLENLILPTRLGNILRAAETYPRTRWGVDSVRMWPRLIYSVSTAPQGEAYLSKVDYSNDQCSFLLNASLLSGIYAVLALLAAVYQYASLVLLQNGVTSLLYFIPLYPIPVVYGQRAAIYLFVCLAGLGLAWYFYNASLWNVSQYGNMIRSTYDLFRFNLLESLHLRLPLNNFSEDEVDENGNEGEPFVWRRISELIDIGHVNGSIYVEYEHPEKPSEGSSTSSSNGMENREARANVSSGNGAIN